MSAPPRANSAATARPDGYCGPKCRIETVHVSDNARLRRGDRIVLVKRAAQCQRIRCRDRHDQLPGYHQFSRAGAEVWIDDGKIGARTVSNHAGRAVLEIFSARGKGERTTA